MNAEEYYGPCLANTPDLNNKAAIRVWFEATEPDEQPKHSRALHVETAKQAIHRFVSGVGIDVVANAAGRIAWMPGTPLPARGNPVQPLAEANERPTQFPF